VGADMSAVIILPETVKICGLCKGWGRSTELFFEGKTVAWCSHCEGRQFVYTCGPAVPESVPAQIATLNGFVERKIHALGRCRVLIGPADSAVLQNYPREVRKPCWELSASPWLPETQP